jgi:hypothetical protein
MTTELPAPRHLLIASDFDQTLSFNDSGVVLSGLIGAERFDEGIRDLYRTAAGGGTFLYTFFKGVGRR